MDITTSTRWVSEMPKGVFTRVSAICSLCGKICDNTTIRQHLRRHELGGVCRCGKDSANLARHLATCPTRSIEAMYAYGEVAVQADGCHIWTHKLWSNGYGKVGGRRAHRIIYELYSDTELEELEACHSCDIKACVNPEHLWKGTQLDNMHDMIAKGRKVVVSGDASPMKDPARRAAMSGANHWTHRLPDRIATGDRHWARKYPELWTAIVASQSPNRKGKVTHG